MQTGRFTVACHDAAVDSSPLTAGEKPIPKAVWYSRLSPITPQHLSQRYTATPWCKTNHLSLSKLVSSLSPPRSQDAHGTCPTECLPCISPSFQSSSCTGVSLAHYSSTESVFPSRASSVRCLWSGWSRCSGRIYYKT